MDSTMELLPATITTTIVPTATPARYLLTNNQDVAITSFVVEIVDIATDLITLLLVVVVLCLLIRLLRLYGRHYSSVHAVEEGGQRVRDAVQGPVGKEGPPGANSR